jgi:hypothetical protein
MLSQSPPCLNVSGPAVERAGQTGAMKSKHEAQKVAEWMLKELKRMGKLHQDTAVYEIAEKFGSRFTYDNEDGNLAIRIDILASFSELTKDSVVWVQEDRYWRMRTPGDGPEA